MWQLRCLLGWLKRNGMSFSLRIKDSILRCIPKGSSLMHTSRMFRRNLAGLVTAALLTAFPGSSYAQTETPQQKAARLAAEEKARAAQRAPEPARTTPERAEPQRPAPPRGTPERTESPANRPSAPAPSASGGANSRSRRCCQSALPACYGLHAEPEQCDGNGAGHFRVGRCDHLYARAE